MVLRFKRISESKIPSAFSPQPLASFHLEKDIAKLNWLSIFSNDLDNRS